MAWKIQIEKAKPNPAGKDTAGGYPLAKQLLGEWVDLKNTGDQSIRLDRIYLANRQFNAHCQPEQNLTVYWYGPSTITLAPSETVRVHTGKSVNAGSMDPADWLGPNHHSYAEKGTFVLNNRCGDDIGVFWRDTEGKERCEDFASYDPRPPEGAIFYRVGAKLVAFAATGSAFRR